MKAYKVVRRFPFDEPVIEKSFDTELEALAYKNKVSMQEDKMNNFIKATYTIETDCNDYDNEEEENEVNGE